MFPRCRLILIHRLIYLFKQTQCHVILIQGSFVFWFFFSQRLFLFKNYTCIYLSALPSFAEFAVILFPLCVWLHSGRQLDATPFMWADILLFTCIFTSVCGCCNSFGGLLVIPPVSCRKSSCIHFTRS